LILVRDRARAGQLVEIGCIGGHGRTGTALACLAFLSGVQRQEAVPWVKANYCSSAVESPEQAAFVTSLDFGK
jgi:protein-tyrosine phosphatase